jgi:ribosomal protein S27E
MEEEPKFVNDKYPNFWSDGQFFLVRCFECNKEYGTENYAPAVASGECAWCGWKMEQPKKDE